MNALLAICMIVSATSVWAGEGSLPKSREAAAASGEAIAAKYSDGYRDLRLVKSPVKENSTVSVDSVMTTHDLRSTPLPLVQATFTDDAPVPKADGPTGRTVAEIVTKCDELKDQPILVRGKVVKYLPEIMGLNWVHLRDGTGSAVDSSNDLVVTTTDQTKVGDTVTVRGIVRTDIDFGSGYAYKVLIDEATLQ